MSFTGTVQNPETSFHGAEPSLDKLQVMQLRTYHARDQEFLSDWRDRLLLLGSGTSDLFDALRREPPKEDLEVATARIINRIFCIANNERIIASEGMMLKFPLSGCVNCHHSPCICGPTRPDAVLGQINEEQADWSLKKWQTHLSELFGPANQEHGKWFCVARLAVETTEMQAELIKQERKRTKPSRQDIDQEPEDKKLLALEVADTLAWSLGVASLVGVDAEKSFLDRFGNGCPTCHQAKCVCQEHNFQPVKFG